jgi:hypothetical protein
MVLVARSSVATSESPKKPSFASVATTSTSRMGRWARAVPPQSMSTNAAHGSADKILAFIVVV